MLRSGSGAFAHRAGGAVFSVLVLCWLLPGAAAAASLREAVAAALETNPEIGEAIANQHATEFELRQSRSQYLPRVDLQTSTGPRKLDNATRRAAGIDDRALDQREIGLTANLNLFDGFARESEIERNIARVDRAAHQLLDRSENIALAISREYIQIVLQSRVLTLAQENVRYHKSIRQRIEQAVKGGGLTAADRQQAAERVAAAEARVVQAREELERARIGFFRQVGLPPAAVTTFPRLGSKLPWNSTAAIEEAYHQIPRVKAAEADVDSAAAALRGARSNYLPKVGLEGSVRTGHDIDGTDERTTDQQVKVVGKWNLFAGGADIANEHALAQRVTESRMRLDTVRRDVRESLAAAQNNRRRQAELAQTLRGQAALGKELVSLYDEQFKAGRRTLLDLLSAQNNYFNALVLAETAQHSRDLAEYRVLATLGQLVATLGVGQPQAHSHADELILGWRATVTRH